MLKIYEFSFAVGQADRRVFDLLSEVNRDFGDVRYLDIGASHYLFANNTYLFYLKGATGVLVDANPDLCKLAESYRPRDIVINCGVSPTESRPLTFYMTTRIGRNSFIKKNIEKAMPLIPDLRIIDEIEIPMRSANSIIYEYFPDGHIDLLTIDVEGMDYEILESLDWSNLKIDVLMAELNPKNKKHVEFVKKMCAKGYNHEILQDYINLFHNVKH